jgi:hypothetical protein
MSKPLFTAYQQPESDVNGGEISDSDSEPGTYRVPTPLGYPLVEPETPVYRSSHYSPAPEENGEAEVATGQSIKLNEPFSGQAGTDQGTTGEHSNTSHAVISNQK